MTEPEGRKISLRELFELPEDELIQLMPHQGGQRVFPVHVSDVLEELRRRETARISRRLLWTAVATSIAAALSAIAAVLTLTLALTSDHREAPLSSIDVCADE